MTIWKNILAVAVISISLGITATVNVGAIEVFDGCAQNPGSAICQSQSDDAKDMVKDGINAGLGVLGMLSVIMVVVGAMRYTLSNGESKKVSDAKNTIIYSVVGLVVAILAFTIVNFVIGRLS